ncbi:MULTISPECIES: HPr family phosphocarrier protein [unclassified Parvimonas]|uniref:HPr family phosphocarrier protein n=1 Tax=unclassified Parvimonas TaxID=1151464 RepID=UPI00020DDA66|nr:MULTISPECIES: HPr family phosphocarrier protein [unclassified Parvimonas]EGL38810.1 phosphocarrier, HPr family [Parvimonas sp. oral taxon 110 str. F0139]MBF1295044.1 HPr family phosphocarrier protein [Parvimonas sp.]MBF1299459.1 HPr family phosphocarrier protein [Parvimonas sp.]MEB3011524.1 HPr family phosphocarrier protein [Parvimonas sp. D2]MEB3087016.1 HPr family phosphocarrier protein [Parvimonas sp. D4]
MLKEKVVVKSEIGLNARVASMFLRNSVKFNSDIILIKDNNRYNGKSILSILSMQVGNGEEIEIEVTGDDENVAMETLISFFEQDLKEFYTI